MVLFFLESPLLTETAIPTRVGLTLFEFFKINAPPESPKDGDFCFKENAQRSMLRIFFPTLFSHSALLITVTSAYLNFWGFDLKSPNSKTIKKILFHEIKDHNYIYIE